MNVAVATARLGAPTAFLGCVSTDHFGEQIWNHLLANGVDLSVCSRNAAATARAIVEHRPELVFRFEGDETADMQLESADLSTLGGSQHLLHGGTLGLFRGRTAETLASLVERHDGLVSFDPNVRPQIIDDRDRWHHFHERWLSNTSIYKGSDEDMAWIWPNRSPASCAEELLAQGVKVVVVTQGADGLSVLTKNGEVRVTAPKVDVVDTVGAGDTIVATVLVSLLELGVADGTLPLADLGGETWKLIGERAVTSAGITCSRPGADPPIRSELSW